MTNFERLIRPSLPVDIHPPRRTTLTKSKRTTGPAQVTLSGTAGGTLTVQATSATLPGSPVIITQGVVGTNTDAVLALVAQINGNSNLTSMGVSAAVMPGNPLQFTITQPTDLNPQIVFSGSSTGPTVMQFASDNVELQAGRQGTLKTWSSSSSVTIKHYNHKYPKEIPFETLNLQVAVLPELPRIKIGRYGV